VIPAAAQADQSSTVVQACLDIADIDPALDLLDASRDEMRCHLDRDPVSTVGIGYGQ
jgi:hypothetical protein